MERQGNDQDGIQGFKYFREGVGLERIGKARNGLA